MNHNIQKSNNNAPRISQEWKDKVLSAIPPSHTGRFVSSGNKCIHIKKQDDAARMTLEWANGERDILYIKDLNVSKEYRNKGLGKELLHIAEILAHTTGRPILGIFGRLSKSQTAWLERHGFLDSEILFSIDILDGCKYDDDINVYLSGEVFYMKHLRS